MFLKIGNNIIPVYRTISYVPTSFVHYSNVVRLVLNSNKRKEKPNINKEEEEEDENEEKKRKVRSSHPKANSASLTVLCGILIKLLRDPRN